MFAGFEKRGKIVLCLIDLYPDKSGLNPKLIDPEKSGPPLPCGLWPQDKAIQNSRDGRLLCVWI
jgi:hypothetical protein